MNKLEIGAGGRPTPGYIHQDIRALDDIEIVCDARDIELALHWYDPFDEVRATHVLEHFSYTEVVDVLKEWKKVLRGGGRIYIEVPNFDWQMRAYVSGEISIEEAVYFVYGEQDYSENSHMNGFNQESLRKALETAGFQIVTVSNIGQVLIAEGWKDAS